VSKNTYKLIIEIGDMDGGPIASGGESKQEFPTSKQKVGAGIFTAYTIIDPFVKKAQSIMMDNVQTQYANTELSQRIQIGLDVANKAVDIGANLIGGATIASALGLGAKFGLVAGAVLSAGSIAMDFVSNMNKINNQRIIENETLQVLRGRAGIQFNKSRGAQ